MERKYIWISFLLILFSCGSRQKQINKEEIRKETEISQNSQSEVDLKINRSESEIQVADLNKVKISVIPKCQDSGSENKPDQNRNITVKDSKGNKTTVPVSSNSEIHIENISETISKFKQAETELGESRKEISNLKAKNKELQEKFDSELKRNKSSWWLFILIGMGIIPGIKIIIKKWIK